MKRKMYDALNLLPDQDADENPEKKKPSEQREEFDLLDDPSQIRQLWKPKKSDSKPENTSIVSEQSIRGKVEVSPAIMKLVKEVAESAVPIVQHEYFALVWDEECVPAMKPFIKKCLYLCWMMIVQSPPMCFAVEPKPGEHLDTNVYKTYTTIKKNVAYVVWPALLLHEDGPLIRKGVAQGK